MLTTTQQPLHSSDLLKTLRHSVPSDGLVLYLPGLDYGNWHTGTIKDYSGQGNHGTITGATPTRLSSGLWVLSFDGTNDLVNCGSDSSLDFTTNLTAIAWVKPSSLASNHTIFGQSSNQSISIRMADDGVNTYTNWTVAGNDKGDFFAVGVSTDVWQMISVTFDSALPNQNLKVYKNDGSAVTANRGAGDTLTASNTLYLSYFWGGFRFNGIMGLPLLSNTTWSQSQIVDWYNQTLHLFGV